MTADLTVPATVALLRQLGHTDDYAIWSETHGLPLRQLDTGWQVTETGSGWLLYRSERGERVTPYRCFNLESQLCAELLAGVLGRTTPPPRPATEAAFDTLLARWRHTPWRLRPATRGQLAEALAQLGVPASAYSLYGGAFEGRLCLEQRIQGWRVHRVRSGRTEPITGWTAEPAACAEFWRRLVDEDLPTLLGADPQPLPAAAEPESPPDDLSLPEALAIEARNGWTKPIGIESPTHGVHRPGPGFDDVAHLHELPNGHWELRYTERGQTSVQASYQREGDAAADLIAPYLSTPGIASPDRHADRFAPTRYEQLLHHWRQLPWHTNPTTPQDLAIALRDHGFPYDSYTLGGGRGSDTLRIAERLDSWRVYQVRAGRVHGETRHATSAEAHAAFWQRAVDRLLPELIAR
ncbi:MULTISPECIES: hypothetical protein [unclassified Crossiella]|uniref:hypothetical protein n=1 Tax=unclassified Crossiella TaxID=2620835 RepID=UPI001FFFE53E|nr:MULTISPECIES: hypothetical protein [unclassified Crossiella]MCK2242417.1 hypothetical protein [Crossiella sp. S99.2]MCK2254552.1 hypothetical protein [Crossiella sp. S99.1]